MAITFQAVVELRVIQNADARVMTQAMNPEHITPMPHEVHLSPCLSAYQVQVGDDRVHVPYCVGSSIPSR